MANTEYEQIRTRVIEWARQVGALARERMGNVVTSQKADRSLVTDVDHAVQDMLLDRIAREFPADAAITEETQQSPNRHASVAAAKRCWIIDPIDGTRNYARGVPIFTTAIALMEAGSPVVGVIHNPMTGSMYSASLGGGTWMDGARVRAADDPMPGGTLIAVPSARRGPLPEVLHRWMDRMVLRNTGSTALHLALVGCGAVDAAYSDDCRLWDVAAGAIIVTEGGAVFTSPQGRPQFPMDLSVYKDQDVAFIAAGPKLAAQMLADYQAGRRCRNSEQEETEGTEKP